MEPIFVTGIVFFFVYKIVELLVRQKERRLMVEKMTEISPEMLQQNINSMKSVQNDSLMGRKFSTLRWGALLLGVGFGWLLGWILYLSQTDYVNTLGNWDKDHFQSSIMISTTAFCAGIALIVVYIIERKASKEAKKAE
jgi:hypothetical protein